MVEEVVRLRLRELLVDAKDEESRYGSDLAQALKDTFTTAGALETRQTIGDVWDIDVEYHDNGRLGVVATLSLACGGDSSLFLYEWEAPKKLQLVLAQQKEAIASISDGQLDLAYELLPARLSGQWLVLTTHGSPWCTAGRRGIDYRVLAPSQDPLQPRIVMQETSPAVGRGKPKLVDNGFCVQFSSWMHLVKNKTRHHVHCYEQRGEAFVRVPPDPDRTLDIPDVWASLPWPHASSLTAPSARARLASVHRRLAALAPGERFARVRGQYGNSIEVWFECDTCRTLPPKLQFDMAFDGPDNRLVIADISEGPSEPTK